MKGDGRVGGGDAVDVGVDGGVVEEASGEEDGDLDAVVEEVLGEFNHGHYVAYAWSWIQHYSFFHHSPHSQRLNSTLKFAYGIRFYLYLVRFVSTLK